VVEKEERAAKALDTHHLLQSMKDSNYALTNCIGKLKTGIVDHV